MLTRLADLREQFCQDYRGVLERVLGFGKLGAAHGTRGGWAEPEILEF